MKKNVFIELVREANFRKMFITEMGWNNYHGVAELPPITIGEIEYSFRTIAERSGFQILQCQVDTLPQSAVCKRIDTKLRRSANDYIAIYILKNTEHHQWVAPVRQIEKRDLVTIEYETAEKSDFLFSKINDLSFANSERATIVDVKERIQGAFAINSEKITKSFYTSFKEKHNAFGLFISGIDDNIELKNNRNKQWYVSVMLNRLMFCYFIQKKGFLDGNVHYLRDKLAWCRQKQGEDQFFKSFYQGFLVQLFQDGLNTPTHQREFEAIYGKIPYLNGGMFDQHQIEQDYAHIDIADEAFAHLFAFFDDWRWHLDTRISASGKDINPDVLGYIFEQYINDRAQMGAYYTKEDITEYIGRNCILPFLMDKTSHSTQEMEKEFRSEAYVWSTLRQSGDRYVYDAVKQGYSPDWQERIPQDIAVGIDTTQPNLLERRKEWNRPTTEPWALPTEIWRETIERLQRYEHILYKITAGELTQINDFITYNLDIRLFVQDILTNTPNHKLIAHFYQALQQVTILDPTCGSGAFLFAAMNILEPLYEICIERMQEFHEQNDKLFVAELSEISHKYRSNIQYFIFKSIILRNLYGVDIMQEATEIAKLRLFLKMVAVVDVDQRAPNLGLDPLPDIDFNIRCGNTLVGYANEDEIVQGSSADLFTQREFREKVEIELEKVSMAYGEFRHIQLSQHENMLSFKAAKEELRKRLYSFTNLLDHQLFSESKHHDFTTWYTSYQPFHWIAEFYQIIHGNGGFDIVIGNPPYVEYSESKMNYNINIEKYNTYKSKNLYSYVFERSNNITNNNNGRIGLIVQISSISTPSMETMCKVIKTNIDNSWISNYATRPSYLFDGVCMNLTIIIGNKNKEINKACFSTNYIRWNTNSRWYLFKNIRFINYTKDNLYFNFALPKLTSQIDISLINKLIKEKHTIQEYLSLSKTQQELFYRTAGGRYFKIFSDRDFGSESKSNKSKYFRKDYNVYVIISILSSNYWWWYYTLHFDMYNCKDYMMYNFNFDYNSCDYIHQLAKLGQNLCDNIFLNASCKSQKYETTGNRKQLIFHPASSKSIIDEIDKFLAKHYNFTEEELDFITNYDIKYRMGDELNNEGDE